MNLGQRVAADTFCGTYAFSSLRDGSLSGNSIGRSFSRMNRKSLPCFQGSSFPAKQDTLSSFKSPIGRRSFISAVCIWPLWDRLYVWQGCERKMQQAHTPKKCWSLLYDGGAEKHMWLVIWQHHAWIHPKDHLTIIKPSSAKMLIKMLLIGVKSTEHLHIWLWALVYVKGSMFN